MDPETLQELRALFDLYDVDCSGTMCTFPSSSCTYTGFPQPTDNIVLSYKQSPQLRRATVLASKSLVFIRRIVSAG